MEFCENVNVVLVNFLAFPGQETTSTLLSFTTGVLIQHPDVLQRLNTDSHMVTSAGTVTNCSCVQSNGGDRGGCGGQDIS